MQHLFMELGYLEFCCSDRDCKIAQRLGQVIWEFCKIIISFKKNALIQLKLKIFGFDQKTVDTFIRLFVKEGNSKGTIKVHPSISSTRNRSGDEFIDLFEIY